MDPYIMGYKIRRRFIDEAFYDYVFDRFGNASPVIVLNGAIIGVWDVADDKNLVKFFLFNQMQDDIYEKVIETGISVGRFYCEREVDIMEVRSMIPVKKLTAGSFMSPLKNMPGE
ncbi:MAG: winged helix DNA-binding domain-containing protein [Bacteroidales bacterium]|nr:winged helix DNA-binding domain-containing protein [Bacteroidales bacterium]